MVADGVQHAVQPLRRAVEAIAGEEIRLLVLEQPHRPRQLSEVDRQVGVGVEDQILRGRGVTGAQSSPEAAVDGVVDHPHPWIGGGQAVGPGPGAVGGGVVDDHDLPVATHLLEGGARGGHRALHVRLLVAHGNDHGK